MENQHEKDCTTEVNGLLLQDKKDHSWLQTTTLALLRHQAVEPIFTLGIVPYQCSRCFLYSLPSMAHAASRQLGSLHFSFLSLSVSLSAVHGQPGQPRTHDLRLKCKEFLQLAQHGPCCLLTARFSAFLSPLTFCIPLCSAWAAKNPMCHVNVPTLHLICKDFPCPSLLKLPQCIS